MKDIYNVKIFLIICIMLVSNTASVCAHGKKYLIISLPETNQTLDSQHAGADNNVCQKKNT